MQFQWLPLLFNGRFVDFPVVYFGEQFFFSIRPDEEGKMAIGPENAIAL